MKKIIPAILTDDINEFEEKLQLVKTFSDWVQIDIMDGLFVNNTSITLNEIDQFLISKKEFSDINLELHLMVNDPVDYFEMCQKIGTKRVIIHFEACGNFSKTLAQMNNYTFQKGVALNLNTGVEEISDYKDMIDLVLLLSVTPGYQGQQFNSEVLKKITKLKRLRSDIIIGIDGGINFKTIDVIVKTSFDYAVVGSGIWKSENKQEAYFDLLEKINI